MRVDFYEGQLLEDVEGFAGRVKTHEHARGVRHALDSRHQGVCSLHGDHKSVFLI